MKKICNLLCVLPFLFAACDERPNETLNELLTGGRWYLVDEEVLFEGPDKWREVFETYMPTDNCFYEFSANGGFLYYGGNAMRNETYTGTWRLDGNKLIITKGTAQSVDEYRVSKLNASGLEIREDMLPPLKEVSESILYIMFGVGEDFDLVSRLEVKKTFERRVK